VLNMDPLSRYLRPSSRFGVVWWLISITLCAVSAWGTVVLYHQHKSIEQEKKNLFRMQQATRVIVRPAPTRTEREAQLQWAALRQELNYSWYPIFAGLEQTANEGIALLEFLPDKASASLTLHGTARGVDALTDYLDALHREPVFKEVYLSHQKKVQQGPLTTLDFEIRLKIS